MNISNLIGRKVSFTLPKSKLQEVNCNYLTSKKKYTIIGQHNTYPELVTILSDKKEETLIPLDGYCAHLGFLATWLLLPVPKKSESTATSKTPTNTNTCKE